MTTLLISLFFLNAGKADLVNISESLLLRQIVNKSEQQIVTLKKILENEKVDQETRRKIAEILAQLTAGINESIEKYKGTVAYQRALIDLQEKNDFANTYEVSERLHQLTPSNETDEKNFESFVAFQKQSVMANELDQNRFEQLQEALSKAKPGFIPKIQAQVQLDIWQSNIRVSAQLTELISRLHAVREELRTLRQASRQSDGLKNLLDGALEQNRKLNGDGSGAK